MILVPQDGNVLVRVSSVTHYAPYVIGEARED
jgi:hypothetical protein